MIPITSEEKCQSVLRALLIAKNRDAATYFRELQQTTRCDDLHDFTLVRKEFRRMMEPDMVHRILSFQETERDKLIATHVMHLNLVTIERKIVSALTWRNWVWYNSIFKLDMFFRTN